MTAIRGLDRLEAPGVWRAGADAPRRDVYVSIGDAELVVQDLAGAALSHWSLPALVRRNPGARPALYAPAEGSDETLEIAEPEMIDALDRVSAAVARGRRRPGRLRRAATGLLIGVAVGFGVMILPDLSRELAADVLPPTARAELGDRMLGRIAQVAGPPCASPTGTEALEVLRDRLLPLSGAVFHVVPDLPRDALALPGATFAISASLLLEQDDPEIVAGHVLSAALSAREADPTDALLAELGPVEMGRLLATGHLPQETLDDHVDALLLAEPPDLDPALLRPGFAAARLSWDAWAFATGLYAPAGAPPMPPAMDDTTWQALRAICEG